MPNENIPAQSLLAEPVPEPYNPGSSGLLAGSDRSEPTGNRLIRRIAHRPHRLSETYYGDSEEITVAQLHRDNRFNHSLPRTDEVKKFHTKQSRRLPHWVWFLIAKCLGIKMHQNDRPWFGTIMHAVTLAFSMTYFVTFTWFTVSDIISTYTKETVLLGAISILIVLYWCSLGIYGNRLASKLFSSHKFVDSVRLHSRTVFKISAMAIMIIVSVVTVTLDNYSSATMYTEPRCINLTMTTAVCTVMLASRIGYSVFCLLWNLLVAMVLLSVCRTHTIGIRRFIRQLEEDGKMFEVYYRNMFNHSLRTDSLHQPDLMGSADDLDNNIWDEDMSPLSDEYCAFPANQVQSGSPLPPSPSSPTRRLQWLSQQQSATGNLATLVSSLDGAVGGADRLRPLGQEQDQTEGPDSDLQLPQPGARPFNHPIIIIKEGSISNSEDTEAMQRIDSDKDIHSSTEPLVKEQEMVDFATSPEHKLEAPPLITELPSNTHLINPDPPSHASRSTQHSTRVELNSPRRVPSSVTAGSDAASSLDNLSAGLHVLSVNDILLCYWRINCRLRVTSLALQRWLVGWIMFILVWSATFLVYWVSHETTLLGLVEFIMPILILPLICSAYAEVNNEGKRMVKSICPTQDRVQMMMMLESQPLELTAFGFPINYAMIITVVGALGVAFSTKIVLEEINVFGNHV